MPPIDHTAAFYERRRSCAYLRAVTARPQSSRDWREALLHGDSDKRALLNKTLTDVLCLNKKEFRSGENLLQCFEKTPPNFNACRGNALPVTVNQHSEGRNLALSCKLH